MLKFLVATVGPMLLAVIRRFFGFAKGAAR